MDKTFDNIDIFFIAIISLYLIIFIIFLVIFILRYLEITKKEKNLNILLEEEPKVIESSKIVKKKTNTTSKTKSKKKTQGKTKKKNTKKTSSKTRKNKTISKKKK